MKTNRTNWLPTMTATAMALLCAQPSLAADGARSPDTSVTRRVVVSIPDRKHRSFGVSRPAVDPEQPPS